jgi:hypothetical protein
MARHNEFETFLPFHFVKYRHNGAARVAEDILDALVFQSLEDQFRAFHFLYIPFSKALRKQIV